MVEEKPFQSYLTFFVWTLAVVIGTGFVLAADIATSPNGTPSFDTEAASNQPPTEDPFKHEQSKRSEEIIFSGQ